MYSSEMLSNRIIHVSKKRRRTFPGAVSFKRVKTQYGNELRINDFHFITDNPWQSAGKEIDITFKIRHTPEFTKGKLVQEGERQFRILSSENLQGIAPGQFGVVYDEAAQVCVGSGEIG